MPELKIVEKVFDLTDNRDLTEMEQIRGNPSLYKIIVDETLNLPFRHITYEVKKV